MRISNESIFKKEWINKNKLQKFELELNAQIKIKVLILFLKYKKSTFKIYWNAIR